MDDMKKLSLLFLAAVISTALAAQHDMPAGDGTPTLRTPMPKKVMLGIDVGVNLARLAVKEQIAAGSLSTNSKTSFHTGLMVDIPIAGMFHLVPEIIYSRQGSKIAATMNGTSTANYEEDLNYLYLAPAVLQLMTPGGFIIQGGPMLGFLLNAKQEGPAPYNTDIKNNRKTTDFMVSGGIGYMTRIGLGAHLRYNHGLSNVLNRDNTQNTGRLENRLVQIGLMYHFGAHK